MKFKSPLGLTHGFVAWAALGLSLGLAQENRSQDPEHLVDAFQGITLVPQIRLFRENRRLQLEALKEARFRRQHGEYSSIDIRPTVGQALARDLAVWLRELRSGLPVPVDDRLLSHLLGFEEPVVERTMKSWLLVPLLPTSNDYRQPPEVGVWVAELTSEPPFGKQVAIRFKETGGAAAMRQAEADAPLPGGPSDEARKWLLRGYAQQVKESRQHYLDLLGSLSAIENKKAMIQLVRGMGQLFADLEASQLTSLMKLVDANVLLKGAPFEPVRQAFAMERANSGWYASALEPGLKGYALKLAWLPDGEALGWEFEIVTRLPTGGQDEAIERCRFHYHVN